MDSFKTFLENTGNTKINQDLLNIFKSDAEFWKLKKNATNDKNIEKLTNYVMNEYSVALNKLIKKYKITMTDLAEFIQNLKK